MRRALPDAFERLSTTRADCKVGDRREFRTTVPEFRFESLDQLAIEALNELLEWLRAAGQRSTEASEASDASGTDTPSW